MNRFSATGAIGLIAVLCPSLASAQTADFWGNGPAPTYSHSSADSSVRLDAGIGALFIEGNEYVLNGDHTLSHLIWQSRAPVLRGSLGVDLNGFTLSAEGSIAGFGSGYMEDYDWRNGSHVFDNWTDRSQHPDTHLEHYVSGALTAGYEIANSGDASVRLNGGIKYTDVKWAAFGGSKVYSKFGFRDDVGNFADGAPAITYRQMLPEIFIGADGDQHYGNVRVGGLLRAGMTAWAHSNDNHWMRDLVVVDNFRVAPTLAVGSDVGFALGPQAEMTFSARYEQKFLMRGRAEYFEKGVRTIVGDDLGGADLRSLDITAGIKGAF